MSKSAPDEYREWKGWDAEAFGQEDFASARYYELELARAGIALRAGLRILEVGFGNGEFAAWARARGAEYIGTEADEALVDRARALGYDARVATPNLRHVAAGPIDVVVAFDVFEHLDPEEAKTVLRSARDCLRPGGLVVIRVPSGDSPFSRAIQHGDLTHRTTIGSGIVRQYAVAAGLEVVQIRPPAFPLLGMGMRRLFRRAPIALLRRVVAAFVNIAFHDNQPRVVTPNMVAVLRKRA